MHLLTFTSLFPNANQPNQGIFISQRMAHFAARPGNRVTAIAPVPYVPLGFRHGRWKILADIPARERIDGMEVFHPRYPLLPKISMPAHGLLMFLASLSLARRLHGEHRFDLVDGHYIYPDGFAAVLIASRLGIPAVLSARGTDINLFPEFRTVRPMIRWALRRAAGVIAVSASLKERMLQMGIPAEKIMVIGNGVDTSRFFPEDRAIARQRLGIALQAQVLICVARLVPDKQQEQLIQAVAKLRGGHPRLRLYLIGDGPMRSQLEALVRQNALEEAVSFVGVVANEELRYWYSTADLTCLPSRREGCPNVLLESLACGTPVVATAAGGSPEVVSDSRLGILVDQGTRNLVTGIEAALGTAWDRSIILRHSQRRSWAAVAQELESALAGWIGN